MSIHFVTESQGKILEYQITPITPNRDSPQPYATVIQPISESMGMNAKQWANSQELPFFSESETISAPFPLKDRFSILTWDLSTGEIDLSMQELFSTAQEAMDVIFARVQSHR